MSLNVACSTDVERMLLQAPQVGNSKKRPAHGYKFCVDPPLPSATITDLCNEPLFFNSYLSDDEDFEGDHRMSFSRRTSMFPRGSFAMGRKATFPELLADECAFMEQQCNEAQAVMFVAVGRPKMVQVAKLDMSSSPVVRTVTTPSARLLPRHGLRKHSIHTLSASRRHSRTPSAASRNLPTTPDVPPAPALEHGLSTPSSACTPLTPSNEDSTFPFDSADSQTSRDASSVSSLKDYRFGQPQKPTSGVFTFSSPAKPARPSSTSSMYTYKPNVLANAPPVDCSRPKPRASASEDRLSRQQPHPFLRDTAIPNSVNNRSWTLRKDSFGPTPRYRRDSKTPKLRTAKADRILGLNSQ